MLEVRFGAVPRFRNAMGRALPCRPPCNSFRSQHAVLELWIAGASTSSAAWTAACIPTGIAKDVARRVDEHNANNLLAANYTRARRPVMLVYQEAVATRSAAGKREYAVKCMSRAEKEALIVLNGPSLKP
jgi:putative endonuclease